MLAQNLSVGCIMKQLAATATATRNEYRSLITTTMIPMSSSKAVRQPRYHFTIRPATGEHLTLTFDSAAPPKVWPFWFAFGATAPNARCHLTTGVIVTRRNMVQPLQYVVIEVSIFKGNSVIDVCFLSPSARCLPQTTSFLCRAFKFEVRSGSIAAFSTAEPKGGFHDQAICLFRCRSRKSRKTARYRSRL